MFMNQIHACTLTVTTLSPQDSWCTKSRSDQPMLSNTLKEIKIRGQQLCLVNPNNTRNYPFRPVTQINHLYSNVFDLVYTKSDKKNNLNDKDNLLHLWPKKKNPLVTFSNMYSRKQNHHSFIVGWPPYTK